MTGTVVYDGPGLSEIQFSPQPADVQQAFFDYGIGEQWEGGLLNEPPVIDESVGGTFSMADGSSPLAPLLVSNVDISRAATTCGDKRDAIIAEYQEAWY